MQLCKLEAAESPSGLDASQLQRDGANLVLLWGALYDAFDACVSRLQRIVSARLRAA
jgi:hypothetical protein